MGLSFGLGIFGSSDSCGQANSHQLVQKFSPLFHNSSQVQTMYCHTWLINVTKFVNKLPVCKVVHSWYETLDNKVTDRTTTNAEWTAVQCWADHFEKTLNGWIKRPEFLPFMMRKPPTEYPYALNTRVSLSADLLCNFAQIPKMGMIEKSWVTPQSPAIRQPIAFPPRCQMIQCNPDDLEMRGLKGTVSEMSTANVKENWIRQTDHTDPSELEHCCHNTIYNFSPEQKESVGICLCNKTNCRAAQVPTSLTFSNCFLNMLSGGP